MPTKTPSRAKSKAATPREPVHTPRPSKSVVAAAAGPAAKEDVGTPTIYCTIAAARDLPAALLLHDSLSAAQGAVDFRLLIAENPAVVAHLRKQLPAALRVLGPDDVGTPHWLHMAFCYEREPLAAVLQPALLRTLVKQGNVVYLAAQSEAVAPLADLQAALQAADVVCMPSAAPPPADDGEAAQGELLRPVNLGLLGLKKSAVAERLLKLWQDLVFERGVPDDAALQLTGPLWLRAVAATAPQLHVLPEAQYVVADGASLTRQADRGAAQTPAALVWLQHTEHTDRAPADAPDQAAPRRADSPANPPEDSLHTRYLRQLTASPYRHLGELPYSFAHYLSGAAISSEHRRALGRLPASAQRLIDNPFAAESLITQLADPAQAALPGLFGPVAIPCTYCIEQEARLNRLPYSVIGYAGKALDLLGPGTRDRVYNLLQRVSTYGGRLRNRSGGTPENASTAPNATP